MPTTALRAGASAIG
uniref:Uncharacterized protein n=1 Tax=Macrostomum lignano TaxID=282301 RepID=A0A1I8J797_9PLAT